MDIKKEFEPSLKTESVQRFFQELLVENSGLPSFSSLREMIGAVNDRSSNHYDLNDSWLLAIVGKIQRSSDKEAGMILLTYLLAAGLQKILRENFKVGDDLHQIWSDVWWTFFQIVERYSTSQYREKVAAILLRLTDKKIKRRRKKKARLENEVATPEDLIEKTSNIEEQNFLEDDVNIFDEVKLAGLKPSDLDLVITSRVYGEALEDIAKELGIKYSTVQKRRKRTEQKLRKYFRNK